MKDNPSPPPAPDPTATANAQSGSNIATAIANAQLNRVNQQTPWGSITYTQGAPGANGVPTWSSQIQLSPQQQAMLDQQQGMGLQRNATAQQYLNQVSGAPLNLSNLHPLNERGQMYYGAVNAPGTQAAPAARGAQSSQGSSASPQIMQAVQAALAAAMQHQAQAGAAAPATTPAAPAAPTTPAAPPSSGLDLSQPLWGSSNGMVYQYGHDSQGRDTFGPGTDEAGNPLGNQDGSMIGSRDLRYGSAQTALNQHPGMTQLRVAQQGVPGGFKDPKLVQYDPTVGYVTPVSNIVESPDDTTARMLMVLAPALGGMAAGAFSGAGIGGGAAAGEAGSAAGSVGGLAGDESAGLSMANPFSTGVEAGAGAPVTDLSVNATQPGMFQQMGNNFMNGRGLLGMNPGQRAAVGLLPSLLRRPSTGGGK
jgi:hypothetical protein